MRFPQLSPLFRHFSPYLQNDGKSSLVSLILTAPQIKVEKALKTNLHSILLFLKTAHHILLFCNLYFPSLCNSFLCVCLLTISNLFWLHPSMRPSLFLLGTNIEHIIFKQRERKPPCLHPACCVSCRGIHSVSKQV